MTIYTTNKAFKVSPDNFYKVEMKKEFTHEPKSFTSLGDGVEGAVDTYSKAGYYLQDVVAL